MKDRQEYNEYHRINMAARYERRKAESIALLGGQCVRCGSVEDLQFDHKDPKTKKFVVGKRLAGVSKKLLSEELAKCQLLCAKCHEAKTIVDLGFTPAKGMHGTISSRRYCSCDLCKEAVRRRAAELRRRDGIKPFVKSPHGTTARYRDCGPPKCDACKTANTQRSRDYRKKCMGL